MFIPVAYKNYALSLLHINFIQFIIPAAVFYVPYLLSMTLVGASLSNFEEATDKRSWNEKSTADKVKFYFTSCLMVLTIVIIVVTGHYSCKQMKKLDKQEKRKEEIEKRRVEEEEAMN